MNLFVGNLSFSAIENDIKALFEAFGPVTSVRIKKKSGKNSRGFGFVSMPDEGQAQAAMAGLQNKDFMGRPLIVTMERPKAIKPKKDYKEIKRISRLVKSESAKEFLAPVIPEKEITPKSYKKLDREDKLPRKSREEAKRFSQPAGVQIWVKRKGRGTAKPWKKKPGGVNKKFKYAR